MILEGERSLCVNDVSLSSLVPSVDVRGEEMDGEVAAVLELGLVDGGGLVMMADSGTAGESWSVGGLLNALLLLLLVMSNVGGLLKASPREKPFPRRKPVPEVFEMVGLRLLELKTSPRVKVSVVKPFPELNASRRGPLKLLLRSPGSFAMPCSSPSPSLPQMSRRRTLSTVPEFARTANGREGGAGGSMMRRSPEVRLRAQIAAYSSTK